MDESFVTTAATVTTALPEAPFFTMPNVFILLPPSGLDPESGFVYPRHSGLTRNLRLFILVIRA